MSSLVQDPRALHVLRESWPGAFRVQKAPDELRRDAIVSADRLVTGDRQVFDQLFQAMDSEPPQLQWAPRDEDLVAEELVFLRRYWLDRMRGSDLPLSSGIDALDLVPALGFLMLMQPLEDAADFRYRVYGSSIVEYSKIEMTGKCIWDLPSPWVATYFAATYRAVCLRGEALYSCHRSRLDQTFAQWERLIVPFVNADGIVDRLLVGNIPSTNR